MKFLRHFALWVLATVFGFMLSAIVWSSLIVGTLGNRNTIKNWLDQSGAFDKIVGVVLDASKNSIKNNSNQSLPINDPQIKDIANNALTPQFLRENTDKVLDGVYDWLGGKSTLPDFSINLADTKQQLVSGLSNYAQTKAAALPACPKGTTSPDSFDVFNATCLPAGTSPQAVAAQFNSDLTGDKGILSNTTFTANDIKVKQNGQDVSVFSKASYAPKVYRWSKFLPWLLGVVALLCAAAIILMSDTRLAGLRRVGVLLVTSGAFLLISVLLINWASSELNTAINKQPDTQQSTKDLVKSLTSVVTHDINRTLYIFGGVFAGLGAAAIASCWLLERKTAGKGSSAPLDVDKKEVATEAKPDKKDATPQEPKQSKT